MNGSTVRIGRWRQKTGPGYLRERLLTLTSSMSSPLSLFSSEGVEAWASLAGWHPAKMEKALITAVSKILLRSSSKMSYLRRQWSVRTPRVAATQRSKIAIAARTRHAPAMAPWEEGINVLNKRLSPPVKCRYGVIIIMSIVDMLVAVAADEAAVEVGIDIDIDISMAIGLQGWSNPESDRWDSTTIQKPHDQKHQEQAATPQARSGVKILMRTIGLTNERNVVEDLSTRCQWSTHLSCLGIKRRGKNKMAHEKSLREMSQACTGRGARVSARKAAKQACKESEGDEDDDRGWSKAAPGAAQTRQLCAANGNLPQPGQEMARDLSRLPNWSLGSPASSFRFLDTDLCDHVTGCGQKSASSRQFGSCGAGTSPQGYPPALRSRRAL
ncbi:predicted protein [Postia placenta Mad-698-R]|uniref:Uncharacterized protein n=1 Tax=Postia placenta MAD-698-R-SB12 TaxID=670580 RepID=A0A1X6NGW9_9APHY|nr:hypothetical protein POSPLADRAFT_1042945 [Postia placenta MAD-698-R-SB12]EED81248.1 predicted protein [Postia placenta Mad-698-R]OSX67750.1 hypothetical protein POSPLADRAFT_1042945 [Postia placenta MAD-698-R-SB12]